MDAGRSGLVDQSKRRCAPKLLDVWKSARSGCGGFWQSVEGRMRSNVDAGVASAIQAPRVAVQRRAWPAPCAAAPWPPRWCTPIQGQEGTDHHAPLASPTGEKGRHAAGERGCCARSPQGVLLPQSSFRRGCHSGPTLTRPAVRIRRTDTSAPRRRAQDRHRVFNKVTRHGTTGLCVTRAGTRDSKRHPPGPATTSGIGTARAAARASTGPKGSRPGRPIGGGLVHYEDRRPAEG